MTDSAPSTPPSTPPEHPFEAPGLVPWLRSLAARGVGRWCAADVVLLAALVYVVVIIFMRLMYSFHPWAMEGDWKQWIWQYHRSWTDGAFPPGHVITDYQFRVQPPLYYVVMTGLSHVMHPGVAARLLGLVALAGTIVGLHRATARLSHWVMGLAALVVYFHSDDLFRTTMGGYPRSFAPTFVFLFMDAWLARRHGRVLAILVGMAAMYPSVLPPCGLAYGVWTALASVREGARAFLVKTGTLALTAGACAALGLTQNLLALPWWGPVISLEEAQKLPALQPGGRMKWLPLGDYVEQLQYWFVEAFRPAGALPHYGLLPWSTDVAQTALFGLVLLLLAVVLVRRARGDDVRVPRELLVLAAAACLSFFAARELAFRLYLPLRVVQHTLPYVVCVGLAALAWQALRGLRAQARATALALVVVWAPLFTLAGDGFIFHGWGIYTHRVPMLEFFRDETPVDAQVAGDLAIVDIVPYFAARQVYVNWTMAHPFRLGYWAEMERRLLRMHEALYATSPADVVKFIDDEKIDYLAIDPRRFRDPTVGRKLFEPIRGAVVPMWRKNAKEGFALEAVPISAVVYSDIQTVVVDTRKLKAAWASASP